MPLVGKIYPFVDFGTKAVAILCIIFLTGVNYLGVVFGGLVQTIVTFIKIATIILLSILLFMFGQGSFANVYSGFQIPTETMTNIIAVIGLALAGAFWAMTDGTMLHLLPCKLRIRKEMFLWVCFMEQL